MGLFYLLVIRVYILYTAASTQGFCDLSDKTRMRLGKIRIETMLRPFSYDLPLSL